MKIGFIPGATISVLLLVELSLRSFFPFYFPDDYHCYQYDQAAGYCYKPSLRLLRTSDYQQELHTNRWGTVNFQKDFSGYRVLVFSIGDSFTQGIGVAADASYPFQLDLMLNMKGNRYCQDYGVVNLGVGGYGPEQELLSLQHYAKLLGPPKYVLFAACDNDFQDDQEFRSSATHRKMVEGNPRFSPFILKPWLWLKFETEIGKRITYLEKLTRKMRLARQVPPPPAQPGASPPNAAALLEPVLNKLVNMTREMQATLIISWIPCNFSLAESREQQWLKAYARKHGIAFADWQPLARSVKAGIPPLPVINHHSGAHYRTWINYLIARAFAQHIH